MEWSKNLSDSQLQEHVQRLQSDIQDFDLRADRERAALELEGRFSASDPLYQRLTFIRDQLRNDLKQAENELRRRHAARRDKPADGVRAMFAAWFA